MKNLLVLAQHPDVAEAVRAAVNPEQYRVLHRLNLDEGEPLLVHGLAEVCLVDLDLTSVQAIWLLEKLRRRAPKCPLVVLCSARQTEWEEEAYVQGVAHILDKPLRPRLLTLVLERLGSVAAAPAPPPSAVPTAPVAFGLPPRTGETTFFLGGVPAAPSQVLPVLRNFSTILTHSLNAEGLMRQFLLLLRDILSISRGAIFLRYPSAGLGGGSLPAESRRLRAVASVGIAPGLLENLELSLDSGLGGQVSRLARIVRRASDEARQDIETQKDFELLGAQVAVPVLDRETLLGVAVFDGRITGEPLANSELELIFHLLEQLGLAIRNIWLHDQLSGNHQMMADILRELSSACIVVSRDLTILHANKTARRYFTRAEGPPGGDLEFSDLPEELGTKVYQVLKTGSAVASFRYAPPQAPGTLYSVNIVPFQRQQPGAPASALLMAEDISHSEQLRRLEIEAANLRLIRTMADRLTHEIGNAMVPLSTHQQLLSDKWKDPEFRSSLDLALAEGVKRVTRLVTQMRFLARDSLITQDAFPVAPLIEEAYQEACKYQTSKSAQLQYEASSKPIIINGDRTALKHALAEVMLNALQANPKEPRIGVRMHTHANGSGSAALQIEVRDNGAGFAPEILSKVPAPFLTNKNVGLGLGLTVSRKIIETHHGKLEIVPTKTGEAGVVRISLPLELAGN